MPHGAGTADTADTAVPDELLHWRRRAARVFAVVSCVLYLVPVCLVVSGVGPPFTRPVAVSTGLAFLSAVLVSLTGGVPHWVRAWVLLGGGYVLSVVGAVAIPDGPFQRALPVVLPMFALVLVGPGSGRAATALSGLLILTGPFLHRIPSVAWDAAGSVPRAELPALVALVQSIALLALLLGSMVVLELFLRYLAAALAGQRRVTAALEEERSRLAEAHARLEGALCERQDLEREIARVGDEERLQLGQDVHDGVCQQLTGALLWCQALELRAGRGEQLTPGDLGSLGSLLREAIEEAHAVARGLWPLDSEPDALAPALHALTERTQGLAGMRCTFQARGDVRADDPVVARHLYRVAQEALSNVARHARAGQVVVALEGCDDALELRVEDDGVGMPTVPPGGRMGLRTMKHRAQIVGADLSIGSPPGGGTLLVCRVPRAKVPRAGATPEKPLARSSVV